MREPKINEAHYTTLLKDVSLTTNQAIVRKLNEFTLYIHELDDSDYPWVSMHSLFFDRYRYYEINDKDEEVFLQTVLDTYEQYLNYYRDLAKAYYKSFDYSVANKRRVHRQDTGTSSLTGTTSSSGSTENDTYGLPNKQVNNLKDGYLTNVEKSTDSNESDSSREGESSLESDIVTTYDNEYLDLKRQYIRQIRDVCMEFIEKFNECFLHVYS